MKIEISEEKTKTVAFKDIKSGNLFLCDGSPVVFIKTNDDCGVALINGSVDDSIHPDYQVIDVTDKYKLANA